MENTNKLNLPYIIAAQAQKHVTHNEALRMLDALIHLSVLSRSISMPPSTPEEGDAYLISTDPVDAWANHTDEIAVFVDGFWTYHTAHEGWLLWISDEANFVIHNGNEWQSPPLPSELNNMESVGVGTSGDTTNKLAVASDASLFTHGGAGHQLKINKLDTSQTASVLFQTNYSGRAEFGTTGDDNWHVKTSADANTWHDAIVADAETGAVSFPSGMNPDLLVPAVDSAGAEDFVIGPPSMHTVSYSRGNLTLVKDRAYFSAFHVDRPTQIRGGVIAQNIASSDVGSILRAGIYELGVPAGNSWSVGNLVTDLGTQSADVTGHKTFDLSTSMTLQPGWYLSVIGTNGSSAQVRFVRWMIPGLLQYVAYGSGATTDLRTSGPSVYMYGNSSGSLIENGYPSIWASNSVIDALSSNSHVYQFMIPKWTRW